MTTNQLVTISILALVVSCGFVEKADASQLSEKLKGRILIQVELKGEAWYVNPANNKRWLLGKPQEALDVIKKLGIGITDANLKKIPIGILSSTGQDSDNDGLADDLEKSIGTNYQSPDSDKDGYNDLDEIKNNYNPNGSGKEAIDNKFINSNSGKIFIQVENKGQAWYLNPADKKRYFLNRPADALNVMKKLGLGIANKDINEITPDLGQIENGQVNMDVNLSTLKPESVMLYMGVSASYPSTNLEVGFKEKNKDGYMLKIKTVDNACDEKVITLLDNKGEYECNKIKYIITIIKSESTDNTVTFSVK
jgi:hypothetical protein